MEQESQAIIRFKEQLIEMVNLHYRDFIAKVQVIKGHPFHLQNAFIRFDEGHYWLHQAIIMTPLQESPKSDSVKPCDPIAPIAHPEPGEDMAPVESP